MKRVPATLLTLAGAGFLFMVSLAGLVNACTSARPAPEPPLVVTTTPPSSQELSSTPAPTSTPTPVITVRPRRMVIDSIGVDAPIMRMAYENGQWTFYGPDEVAWIDGTGLPGSGRNAVFYGHLDWVDREAVFWRLKDVKAGDLVKIGLEDGTELVYKVTSTYFLEEGDPQIRELERPLEGDIITLETCGGRWIPDPSKPYGGEYTHRRILRAERLLESSAGRG